MNRKILELVRDLEDSSTKDNALESLIELADIYEKELANGTASFSENSLIFLRDIPFLVKKIAKDGLTITLQVTAPDKIDAHWADATISED